jgi:hypothetical protein
LCPNKICTLLLSCLSPPRFFTHYFANESGIITFSDVKTMYLQGRLHDKPSVITYFPQKIPKIKKFHYIANKSTFLLFLLSLIYPKISKNKMKIFFLYNFFLKNCFSFRHFIIIFFFICRMKFSLLRVEIFKMISWTIIL